MPSRANPHGEYQLPVLTRAIKDQLMRFTAQYSPQPRISHEMEFCAATGSDTKMPNGPDFAKYNLVLESDGAADDISKWNVRDDSRQPVGEKRAGGPCTIKTSERRPLEGSPKFRRRMIARLPE